VIPEKTGPLDIFIRHWLYPLLFIYMLVYAFIETNGYTPALGAYRGLYIMILIAVMLLVEIRRPLRRQWRMTRATFLRRDLPFMVLGGLTLALVQYTGLELVLWFGLIRGEAHLAMPLIPSVLLILLLTDFLWYWLHRWSHEARGPVGRWLWKMHVAHHLPQQVYVFMHAVGHPINTLLVRIIYTVPLFFLGFSTEAIFVASLVTGLQGLVSHFNVDCRAGFMSYLLMGTESHRYHHSACPEEAKNFAATITLWDILFGTFVYEPGKVPARLGVNDPARYPEDKNILRVLAMPFMK